MSLVRSGGFWAAVVLAGLSGGTFARGQTSTRLEFANDQPGSPVEVTSATSTQKCIFDEVRIKNVSDHVVRVVKLGIMLYPVPEAGQRYDMRKGVLIEGLPYSTGELQPGETTLLTLHFVPTPDLLAREEKNGWTESLADLGVMKVEYEEGEYVYDPNAHHGFRSKPLEVPVARAAARRDGASGRPLFAGYTAEPGVAGPYCGDGAAGCAGCGSAAGNCAWPDSPWH